MADPRAVFSLIGPEVPTDEVVVGPEGTTIGRRPTNTLQLNVQQVSGSHAKISLTNGLVTLEDLGSTNGTHVNETRIEPKQPVTLKLGDVIRIGPFTLTLTHVDQPVASPQITPAKPPPPPQEQPVVPPYSEPTPPPAVHQSEPPASPAEAQTVKPQVTQPKPGASPQVIDTPVKAAAGKGNGHGPQPQDMELEVFRPARPPSTNGHSTEVLAPYVPIEGIPLNESRYMQYLPGVYSDSDFLKRFLLIMESILAPLGWGVDSFEQYYNPLVTTPDWLQWIGAWFDVLVHPSVPVERQRAVVKALGDLYRRRGTPKGLVRLLELYFGTHAELIELDNPPSSFTVRLALGKEDTPLNRALAEQLITAYKPAHTGFTLEIT